MPVNDPAPPRRYPNIRQDRPTRLPFRNWEMKGLQFHGRSSMTRVSKTTPLPPLSKEAIKARALFKKGGW
jgi:hypothetical protein